MTNRATLSHHDRQGLPGLYSALMACDHAIIRSTNQADLFHDVCRNLVKLCDKGLVWIGMLDAQGKIVPQAHYGEECDYLEWIKLTVEVDHVSGPGPADIAIQGQQPIWSHDIANDPRMGSMRDVARAQGWHCAVVLPLMLGDVARGALSLYAREIHALDENGRALLLQLASDIGYALGLFELDAQRKKTEFALQESEVRYSALFASNCMPMLVVDPSDGRVVDANIKALNFYGWDHTTFTAMHVSDFNTLSPEAIRQEMAHAASASKSYFNFQHRVASGEVRDVEVFSSPIDFDGRSYLISAVHDVTERRHLEMRVRSAQSLTQRFIDHLPGTAFVKDSQLRLLMVNQHLGTLLGADPQTLIGKTTHEILPPDFADLLTRLDRQILEQGGSQTFEEQLGQRHYDTSLFVIDDESGQRLLGGLSFDVTDRYRAGERANTLLRLNEMGSRLPEKEFLTQGLEQLQMLTRSRIGFLHFVNADQETLELVTWTRDTLQGCTAAYDAHYPVSQAGIWADALRTQAPAVFNHYADYPAKRGLPQGHATMTRLASVPVVEHGLVRMIVGVGNKEADYDAFDVDTLLLFGNDMWRIVQRARAEVALQQRVEELVVVNQKLSQIQLQLLQSEKMASIGQLASGVAHEINNPIGFVKSNLGSLATYVGNLVEIVQAYEAAEKQLGEAHGEAFAAVRLRKQTLDYAYLVDDLSQLIEESRDGVQRVSKIVLDLKNFSRSGDGQKEWSDLHAGIESTINVVWNQLKYKVEMIREYADLPRVYCVASQINQVVMNLLINAEQAIESHGHITVRTGTEGAHVWFEIQDDGCGISEEAQKRLFEPFYTTKPVGKGTGLGLSIAFGIVQRHQGSIAARSSLGLGSTFRVTLPIAPPGSEQMPAAQEGSSV